MAAVRWRAELKIGDAVILACILGAALSMIAWQILPTAGDGRLWLELSGPEAHERTPVDRIPAEAGWRRNVAGAAGGLVLAYVPEQGFHVESASCPDRLCVNSGFIRRAGQSIVCVPNEIIIRLLTDGGEGGGELDGVLR